MQSENATGNAYVSQYTDEMPLVSVEPKNALLIFASPTLPADMVPDSNSPDVLQPQTGQVSGLDTTSASTIIFNPGVYYMTATAHAQLSSSVSWVYFAPGAYVKGAIQFNTHSPQMKATGYGVLSGEQYVYQANTKAGYHNEFSNEDDLRMWSGSSAQGVQQTFTLFGPTINEQPFNSMDFTGDLYSISVVANQYKQVGAWYSQTDGLEIYPGSHISNTFFHSNDDTIKTYYSNVVVENIVVWKGTTAPTVQFGWHSRNISSILVQNIDINHSRYTCDSSHPSLIGANQEYTVSDESATNTANTDNTVKDFTIKNIRSEGISGNLFRIIPLENIDVFTIENAYIEKLSPASTGIGQSKLPITTDSQGKSITVSDFKVTGYNVGGTAVSSSANNWQVGKLGGLNIPSTLLDDGDISI